MRRLAALLSAAMLAACARPSAGGPPQVRLGEDACARCGMLISDARSGGGWIDEQGRSVVYDDDGELLEALARQPERRGSAFVRDSLDGRWLRVQDALLKKLDGLPTPMGSGYAAFADEAEAASFARAWRSGRT